MDWDDPVPHLESIKGKCSFHEYSRDIIFPGILVVVSFLPQTNSSCFLQLLEMIYSDPLSNEYLFSYDTSNNG